MTYTFRKSLPILLLAAATISTSPTIAMEEVVPAAVSSTTHHHRSAGERFQDFGRQVARGFSGLGSCVRRNAPNAYLVRHLADQELEFLATQTGNHNIRVAASTVHTFNVVVDGVESTLGIQFGAAPNQASILSAVHTINSGIEIIDQSQQTLKALTQLSLQLSGAGAPQTLDSIAHLIASLQTNPAASPVPSIFANAKIGSSTDSAAL
jgi:hypothetical protein